VATLATLDTKAAIARYQDIIDSKTGSSDNDRLCAGAALSKLQPPTVSDRIFHLSNDIINRVAQSTTGRSVSIGNQPSTSVSLAVVAFEFLLVFLAFRQFFLWRGERLPGPVSVAPISPPPDLPDSIGLAEIIRERLASAGVPPGTAGPGELGALVVDAVAVVGGDKQPNWLGAAFAGVTRVLRTGTGFKLTGKAFKSGAPPTSAVSLELTTIRTGTTLDVVTAYAETYEEAAVKAAYLVYIRLASRPAVRERTPNWLSWTSSSALNHYYEANEFFAIGNYLDALPLLDLATVEEPGNLLVALKRARCEQAIGFGGRDEGVLREGDRIHTDSSLRQIYSLRAFLQAALLAPGSDDAIFWVALGLGYVEEWITRFCEIGPEESSLRTQIIELLDDVYREYCGRSLRLVEAITVLPFDGAFVQRTLRDGGDLTAFRDPMASRFLFVSLDLWRWALRQLRYDVVLRRYWKLANRREIGQRIWPLSVLRFAQRLSARASMLATEWDSVRVTGLTQEGARKLKSAEGRIRRRMIVVTPLHLGLISYNLAASFARKANALATINGSAAEEAAEAAVRFLERTALSSTERLSAGALEEWFTDPDLRSLSESEMFHNWARRFGAETPGERSIRVWGRHATLVEKGAALAVDVWSERAYLLSNRHERIDRATVVNWFRHDEAMWTALDEWRSRPSAVSCRVSFETLKDELYSTTLSRFRAEGGVIRGRDAWLKFTQASAECARLARNAREEIEALAHSADDHDFGSAVTRETTQVIRRWIKVTE
jgi:hypothetical protein